MDGGSGRVMVGMAPLIRVREDNLSAKPLEERSQPESIVSDPEGRLLIRAAKTDCAATPRGRFAENFPEFIATQGSVFLPGLEACIFDVGTFSRRAICDVNDRFECTEMRQYRSEPDNFVIRVSGNNDRRIQQFAALQGRDNFRPILLLPFIGQRQHSYREALLQRLWLQSDVLLSGHFLLPILPNPGFPRFAGGRITAGKGQARDFGIGN